MKLRKDRAMELLQKNKQNLNGMACTAILLNGQTFTGLLSNKVPGRYDSENFTRGLVVDKNCIDYKHLATLIFDEIAVSKIATRMRKDQTSYIHIQEGREMNTGLSREDYIEKVEEEIHRFVETQRYRYGILFANE